jgi:hypothetical protein
LLADLVERFQGYPRLERRCVVPSRLLHGNCSFVLGWSEQLFSTYTRVRKAEATFSFPFAVTTARDTVYGSLRPNIADRS